MVHGEKQTIRTRVGGNKIYTKTARFCVRHGWIDTFMQDFDRYHTGCGADDTRPSTIGLELPEAMRASA